jgi:hypothetical protein
LVWAKAGVAASFECCIRDLAVTAFSKDSHHGRVNVAGRNLELEVVSQQRVAIGAGIGQVVAPPAARRAIRFHRTRRHGRIGGKLYFEVLLVCQLGIPSGRFKGLDRRPHSRLSSVVNLCQIASGLGTGSDCVVVVACHDPASGLVCVPVENAGAGVGIDQLLERKRRSRELRRCIPLPGPGRIAQPALGREDVALERSRKAIGLGGVPGTRRIQVVVAGIVREVIAPVVVLQVESINTLAHGDRCVNTLVAKLEPWAQRVFLHTLDERAVVDRQDESADHRSGAVGQCHGLAVQREDGGPRGVADANVEVVVCAGSAQAERVEATHQDPLVLGSLRKIDAVLAT